MYEISLQIYIYFSKIILLLIRLPIAVFPFIFYILLLKKKANTILFYFFAILNEKL